MVIAGALAFEYYAGTQFPEETFQFSSLQVFTDEENSYIFYHAGVEVGIYTFIVERKGTNYLMKSTTDVESDGVKILLESAYIFNANYLPEDYRLNITKSGEETNIKSSFDDGKIITSVTFEGETVDIEKDVENETYLIENSMPGFWEILIRSSNLKPGKRYKLEVFIPQSARVIPITLLVEKKPEKISIDDIEYECTVVKESLMELSFYLHEGQLILYEDFRQDTALRKIL